MELIKSIKEFERYKITSYGRIIGINNQEISQRKASNGYLRVNLRYGTEKYEKPKTRSVHRLVAEAFIENPLNLNSVNHKDGNKENNDVNNLEWVTEQYNTIHSFKIGLQVVRKGKENKLSKKVYQYSLDGKYINCFYGTKEAQRETGVHSRDISACCIHKQKRAKGFVWSYEPRG